MLNFIDQKLKVQGIFYTEEQAIATIGHAAGLCYNASDEYDKCVKRVLQCIKNGHHSVLEHINLTLEVTCDRGTSHALVRHRHCAFTQGSTLYTKYKNGIEVITRPAIDPVTGKPVEQYTQSDFAVLDAVANAYNSDIEAGEKHTLARDVLPNCLGTRIAITTNLREWFWIWHIRQSPADSVRMHVFAKQLEALLDEMYPTLFAAAKQYYFPSK